jgi:hypothetical protein
MKNILPRLLILALIGPSLLLAKDHSKKKETQEEPTIVTLAEFSKTLEAGIELDKIKNIILECPQGAELPIKMTIRGDMLSLEPNLLTIKLLKPCYIKSGKGSLKFSSDLKKWVEFSEFFIGKAAASLEFQNLATLINLELELNLHKNRWELPLQYRAPCKEVYIHTWSTPQIGQGYIPNFGEERTELFRR